MGIGAIFSSALPRASTAKDENTDMAMALSALVLIPVMRHLSNL